LPAKPRQKAEAILKIYEPFIYGDAHYITDSFRKNFAKQRHPSTRLLTAIFINLSYYYQYTFTARDVQTDTQVRMLLHLSLCVLNFLLFARRPNFADTDRTTQKGGKAWFREKYDMTYTSVV
jgi:hypothetical protein